MSSEVCICVNMLHLTANKPQILINASCQKASSITVTSFYSKANDKWPVINNAMYTVKKKKK